MSIKRITLGILAHVDAGKTTLSEALLYLTGEIKKPGRVDHGDSFLDDNAIERNRGITIFSRQARFTVMGSAEGEPDTWVREGEYRRVLEEDDRSCFYRLYSKGLMARFLTACRQLLNEGGSLGDFVPEGETIHALEAFCRWFSERGLSVIVPKDTTSSCKRLCMFMRWMVRDNSPVDLGLWADKIDRKSLIIPMDTHVLTEAGKLGLVNSRTASMSAARRLTAALAQVFPDDPLKGDFALFGYGVNQ